MGKKKKLEKLESKLNKKKVKKVTEAKPEIDYCDAPDERDINTTYGLAARSINMMLSHGIRESRKKDGDPNLDINPKAVEFAIKLCNMSGAKLKESEDAKDVERMLMEDIKADQRKRLHS